jgi:predicted ArsR family transcriptional regulator
MRPAPALDDLTSLALLADPARRRLYALVSEAGRPVGRDEAATAAGIGRSLAAYHLDRLAAEGLLEVTYRRLAPGGAGAGRPAKLYARASRDFVLRAPSRDYELVGELLVRAAEADRSGATRAALESAARALGRELATDGPLEDVLRLRGYEPVEAEPGTLRLRNCPFHALAERSRELVCGINLALLQGLAGEAGGDAVLAPENGGCCVVVRRSAAGSSGR